MNDMGGWQVGCDMPTPTAGPKVIVHTTSGGSYDVYMTNISGTTGVGRWRGEPTASCSPTAIGSNAADEIDLTWTNGMRAYVENQSSIIAVLVPLPNCLWEVKLRKFISQTVTKTVDLAYISYDVSGQVSALRAWNLGDFEMEGSTWSAPTVDLYESLNLLTVRFSIVNHGRIAGQKVEIRIGNGKPEQLGVASAGVTGEERRYNWETSERMQNGPVTGQLVEVLVDGKAVRIASTPNSFPENRYVLDLGKIVLGEDCDTCATCKSAKLSASLSSE